MDSTQQHIQCFSDLSSDVGDLHTNIQTIYAEEEFKRYTKEMNEKGWKLTSHHSSGSRGFFINDYILTAVYEPRATNETLKINFEAI